jgi:hypothetical protein
MNKLVFLILTLSGFLIYKALTIKGAKKANSKSVVSSVSSAKVSKDGRSVQPNTPQQTPHQVTGQTKASDPKAESAVFQQESPTSSTREDFDTLRDVYPQSEEVDETRVTQEEKAAHNETVKQIEQIEAEAAARKPPNQGINKRPEDLTPEEQKQFDIYKTFEKKEDHK